MILTYERERQSCCLYPSHLAHIARGHQNLGIFSHNTCPLRFATIGLKSQSDPVELESQVSAGRNEAIYRPK
jgi:hypothetical protein